MSHYRQLLRKLLCATNNSKVATTTTSRSAPKGLSTNHLAFLVAAAAQSDSEHHHQKQTNVRKDEVTSNGATVFSSNNSFSGKVFGVVQSFVKNTMATSASASPGSRQQSFDGSVSGKEGLVLYYDPFSFYSQKVVMALHEKRLPFEKKTVNLVQQQQYESWYLDINPRGEVPVIQDTGKTIPDSERIIDYLEDNFSNGDTPRLVPMDQGPEVRQSVTHFRHLLSGVPEGRLTTGAMLHPELLKNPKPPFFGPVRKAIADAEKHAGEKLRKTAEGKSQAIKETLLKKADDREARYKELLDQNKFLEVIAQFELVLTQVEEELSKHLGDRDNWWLCSDRFTIADVELTIVLVRISQLGLEHFFWTEGKRPHVEKYFERAKLRESYGQTVPAGIAAVLALIVGGAVLAKKYLFN